MLSHSSHFLSSLNHCDTLSLSLFFSSCWYHSALMSQGRAWLSSSLLLETHALLPWFSFYLHAPHDAHVKYKHKSLVSVLREICSIWLSESRLFCLTWCAQDPFRFLKTSWLFLIYLWLHKIPLCTLPHFYPFVSGDRYVACLCYLTIPNSAAVNFVI